MSSYYHQFTPGWNWYYLFAGVSLLLAVLLGIRQVKFDQKRLKLAYVRDDVSDPVMGVLSVIDAVIFGIMLWVESEHGILQWLDNGLTAKDSPAWSVLLFGPAVIAAAFMYGALVFYANRWTRHGRISHYRRQIAKARR